MYFYIVAMSQVPGFMPYNRKMKQRYLPVNRLCKTVWHPLSNIEGSSQGTLTS